VWGGDISSHHNNNNNSYVERGFKILSFPVLVSSYKYSRKNEQIRQDTKIK
jgi:hypothetical protein